LLARLYDPDSGRIIVDGIDLRELARARGIGRVAPSPGTNTHFELSAHDNVAFGALGRRDDRAGVIARRSGRSGVVIDGLARAGRRRCPGNCAAARSCRAAWQRLALARALFAVDAGAGVLVLDEPTASLDVRGEAEVYQRF